MTFGLIRVGKRDVEAGVVRLRKIVRTEVVTQPAELEREDIVIEQVPANLEAGEDPVSGEAFQDEEIYRFAARRQWWQRKIACAKKSGSASRSM